MDNFKQLIEGIEKTSFYLGELDNEYIGRKKGSVYQMRRSKIRSALKNYMYRLKKLVQGPNVYEITGFINGDKFSITTVNMDAKETRLFLELTTKSKVEITHSVQKEVGKISILE